MSRLGRQQCEACGETYLLHVLQVLDPVWDFGGKATLHRPVGIVPGPEGEIAAGRFEVVVCTRCGAARWYAFEWLGSEGVLHDAPCRDCDATTPHVEAPAREHSRVGVERTLLFHGVFLLEQGGPERSGWLGELVQDVCVRCGRVAWLGRGLESVIPRQEDRGFHAVDGAEPRCGSCGQARAIVVESARARDHQAIPVVIQRRSGLFSSARSRGCYSWRVCRACAALAWYAHDLDDVLVGEEYGVIPFGTPLDALRNPYR